MTGEAEQLSSDKLVKVYLKMRDARAKLSKEFDEADGAIKSQMKLVEVELLKVCNSVGASSIRTEYGTIMRGVDTRYWTSDWGAMHEFIKETGQVDLLRIKVPPYTGSLGQPYLTLYSLGSYTAVLPLANQSTSLLSRGSFVRPYVPGH